ncbi:uncharacterized protein LOC133321837 [Musca vetustissima]|uniref:uncharacterized protein LOC133321837 n=1 Tax=Musca vetustissima TaxID=27455 RepID=UPI002AB6BE0A|nr:uncharacterized protein LOC133321837 [Musca vetustissima]
MKFSVALIAIVALVASGSALPAKKRMVYYQQPTAYYTAPQRMMYVQYVQPARPFARSTQAAEALVAGETVATGTYLKDCNHAEADVAAAGPAVDVSVEHGEEVLSEAEAYPASGEAVPVVPVAAVPAEVDIVAEENEVADEAAKVPRDYNFEAAAEESAVAASAEEAAVYEAEQPAAAAEVPEVAEAPVAAAELPAPAPIAPVAKPAKRYLPSKKKVYVELDQSVEEEEVADEEDEYEVPVAPARRPAVKKPAKAPTAAAPKADKPLPAGTFFPINFGGTSGGAIAIANSFSTGEGGSATSHAIAYGSPDTVRARVRPGKFH